MLNLNFHFLVWIPILWMHILKMRNQVYNNRINIINSMWIVQNSLPTSLMVNVLNITTRWIIHTNDTANLIRYWEPANIHNIHVENVRYNSTDQHYTLYIVLKFAMFNVCNYMYFKEIYSKNWFIFIFHEVYFKEDPSQQPGWKTSMFSFCRVLVLFLILDLCVENV